MYDIVITRNDDGAIFKLAEVLNNHGIILSGNMEIDFFQQSTGNGSLVASGNLFTEYVPKVIGRAR